MRKGLLVLVWSSAGHGSLPVLDYLADKPQIETMNFDSPVRVQSCRTLAGRCERVGIGRRNGQTVLLLAPQWHGQGPDLGLPDDDWLDDSRLYVNLNDVERRTWRRILSAVSINAIAAEEGVPRAAIYARIQGNRFGQGGMIGKNFWVLLWWRLRQQMMAGAR